MSYQCTLAIVGDGAVGKSSIIAAFKSDGFARVYKQVNRKSHIVYLSHYTDNRM